MNVLFVTWDGAGNMPPTVALMQALRDRGHSITMLGHDSQQGLADSAGAAFTRFQTTLQFDHSLPGAGLPPELFHVGTLMEMDKTAGPDALATARELRPDVVVVDCMLPSALPLLKDAGFRTVVLVHGAMRGFGPWNIPFDKADLAISCSYPGFDPETPVPETLRFIGPLRPKANGAVWQRNLRDRPIVLVSLSSGLQGPSGAQLDLLQRICDAVASLPVEVIVTTGRGIVPGQLTAGENTTVFQSLAHDAVLPSASLFITHAGHGSIMAGLRAGVPMLCIPPGNDQPMNAMLVENLNVGITLSVASTPQQIAGAVSRALADEGLRQRSAQFARDQAFAPQLNLAVEWIEQLAN